MFIPSMIVTEVWYDVNDANDVQWDDAEVSYDDGDDGDDGGDGDDGDWCKDHWPLYNS